MIYLLLVAALISEGAGRPEQQSGHRIVHQESTPFGMLFVIDEGGMRYLRFDSASGDDQSMISLNDQDAVSMDYVRFSAVGLGYVEAPQRLLMVGLGGGTFTAFAHRVLPDMEIDVVEVNPAVLRVAEKYFGVSRDARLRVHIDDGRRYLENTSTQYDLILLDAYTGSGIPSHLTGGDFFDLTKRRLSPKGVLVANLAVDDRLERTLIDVIEREVGAVDCFRTPDSLNLIVVAKPVGRVGQRQLAARSAKLDQDLKLPFELARVAGAVDADCVSARSP